MILDKHDVFNPLYEKGYDIEKKINPVIVNLEDEMRKAKISSMSLCKKTGISRQTMNTVLKGDMKPGVDFALKVSKVLKRPVEELFTLHDSAWETLVTENDRSIYFDLKTQQLLENKEVKATEEAEGLQYWDLENAKVISKEEYELILEDEMSQRMADEVEKARLIPVGRKEEKVFNRMARSVIEEDVEQRYPLRFHRVVKNLKPIE